MKKQILALAAIFALSLPAAKAQYPQPSPQINVSGSAEVKVAPDEIRLDVAVETRAVTLDPARLENDQKIAAALNFLKQSKIPDKDVQTDYISVQPQYDYRNGTSESYVKPIAYVVRKNVEIRLTDVAHFQDVLTGLLTNGVNYVNGVNFRTSQLRKYRDQARTMAIKAAKEKAQALTSEVGAALGSVASINVSENNGYYGNYFGNYQQGQYNGFNNMIQNISSGGGGGGGAGSDISADTFAVGQISVTATVNVSFFVK